MRWFMWFVTIYAGGLAVLAIVLAYFEHRRNKVQGRRLVTETEQFLSNHPSANA